MRINKIQLQNYRGAYALSLDLNKTLNIFYGVNGSGKSTLLKSIAVMLSWVVSRLRHSGTSGQFISNTDITNGKNYSIIMLSCSSEEKNIEWQLVKTRQGHVASNNRSNFNDLNDFTKQLQVSISENEERVNLPIFVYYPVDRAVLDIPLRIRGKHSFQILTTYADALGSGTNFRTFFEWFREREDLENEHRKYVNNLIKPENFCFPDRQLEAVRNALKQFLPEFENLTVRRIKKTSATESTSPKKVVKDALIQAQGYICCYCECRITSETSHIEHFRPQSHPSVDPLDFSNLLCSCQKDWIDSRGMFGKFWTTIKYLFP